MLVAINSKTNGKYRKRKINGRDHIITNMMPIRGDTAMNRRFYPVPELQKSFMQLNNLIAPAGHPTVNGEKVSAYHPFALNVNNVGGFTQNPKMKGKEVFVDFALDLERAGQSEKGNEIIERIENRDFIGVSTGLVAEGEEQRNGVDDFGKAYTSVLTNIKFDHVAILPEDEPAAGEHAGTKLLVNGDLDKEIEVIELTKMIIANELSVNELRDQLEMLIKPNDGFAFISDIYPDSRAFSFSLINDSAPETYYRQSYAINDSDSVSLLDDRKQVVRKIVEEEVKTNNEDNQGVDEMDKSKFILALVVNGLIKDKKDAESLSEEQLAALIAKKPMIEEAREVLAFNGFDFQGYDDFVANKAEFELFKDEQAKEIKELSDVIVANSEMTEKMLEGKSVDELKAISKLIPKSNVQRLPASGGLKPQQVVANSDEVAVDYSF